MSAKGRPERESFERQREGSPASAKGRPERESFERQREGSPASAKAKRDEGTKDAPGKHSVYVIELDPAVLGERRFRARNPNYVDGMPCVYVGMTGLAVAERFANHRAGIKSNRYSHRFGLRLLPELYECFNPMPYEAALQMERELADELQEKGYAVWQG